MHSFDAYEDGVRCLLEQLGQEHRRYSEALTLQSRLSENIAGARQYGDDETRRAGRAQIIEALNQLALQTLRISFNELCESQEPEAPTQRRQQAREDLTLGELLERAEAGDPTAIAHLQSFQASLVKALQPLRDQWASSFDKALEPVRKQCAQVVVEIASSLKWEKPLIETSLLSAPSPAADSLSVRNLPLQEIQERRDQLERRPAALDSEARVSEEPKHVARPVLPDLSPCPFVAGPKITDPRLFVGRREELHRLTAAMEGAQPISANVVGERRIGKSSLLYHFYQTWEQRVRNPDRYVVTYLSLQDAAAQAEKDFYRAVAQALLARPGVQRRSSIAEALNQQPLGRKEFAEAMRAFQAQALLPILCLDEFEALFSHPRQFDDSFYDALRALMDDNALMLVAASLKPLDVYRRQHRLTSSFFNVGQLLQLGELTEDEAADLVRLPASTIRGAPAALSLEEQHLARQWGGRHPCLLQLAACFLCQARQEGRDAAWARERFDAEARRVPYSGYRLRRLWQPLRWLAWSLPARLGGLARGIGGAVDEFANWVIGMTILIAIALAVLGILTRTQVLDLLRRALGGP
ncbi:MAG: ATP-binding protein [Anaerolineae bacterium]|nr:ATP-binding protein [Anaerolineae bacterium]